MNLYKALYLSYRMTFLVAATANNGNKSITIQQVYKSCERNYDFFTKISKQNYSFETVNGKILNNRIENLNKMLLELLNLCDICVKAQQNPNRTPEEDKKYKENKKNFFEIALLFDASLEENFKKFVPYSLKNFISTR